MKRKDFLRTGIFGLGSVVGLTTLATACKKDELTGSEAGCEETPPETEGPFPIKTPGQLVKENIVSDRTGVAMLLEITVQNVNDHCDPLEGVYVDVWHCDKDGNYSQYGGTQMQQTDYTDYNFLRGRQLTASNGKVAFLSVFPGWYSGRAPHIHVEVLTTSEKSLLVTQIAFPEDVAKVVYASALYASHGQADTSNTRDNIFSDSLDEEMATVTGNVSDGYTVSKIIMVKG